METFSFWHWAILAVILAAVVIPFWRIFPRAGMSPWWSLLMVVGPLNFILLWVLAFRTWPADRREH